MPRCFSISIQSEVAWREALRAFTLPAMWIAPAKSSSFSVSVVLPASGWEMMAKVRRRRTSEASSVMGQSGRRVEMVARLCHDRCVPSALLNRYAGHGHAKVEGWLMPIAITVLRRLAETQGRSDIRGPVVEIGVHHGRLFLLLHLLSSGEERSVAYDLFDAQAENVDHSGEGNRAAFERNVRVHGDRPERVVVRAVNSLRLTPDAITADAGGRVRLFSVDGGHTAAITANDLALAEATLCRGGLVILDDFFNEAWPGVSEGACRHLAGGSSLVPVAIAGNKVVFTNDASLARTYQDDLRSLKTSAEVNEQTFFDQPALVLLSFNRSALRRAVTSSRLWGTMRDTGIGRAVRSLVKGH